MATWIPESASRSAGFGLPGRGALARLAREPVALAGLVMVALYAAVALFVGLLPLRDPLQLSTERLAAPSAAFPFGTDALGRDLLSRVLYGARLSMQVALVSVAVATAAGAVLGLVSGYLGGFIDQVIGRVMDVFFAFPAILLALGIVAALGPDPGTSSSPSRSCTRRSSCVWCAVPCSPFAPATSSRRRARSARRGRGSSSVTSPRICSRRSSCR
jgi:ABC-type dipeptide/oligopeptide/nickel transport system permease subunit